MGLPFFSKKKEPQKDNFLPKLDLNDIRRVAKSSGRTKKDILEEELITELNKDLKEIRESTLESPKEESYDVVGIIENPDKTPIKNLSELIEFVKNLPEPDLKKYVNPKFNLFSDFAQDKFGQIALSVELALLNNKQDIVSKLQAFLISEGNLIVSNKEKSSEKDDASKEMGEQGSSPSNQRKVAKSEAQKILMKTPDAKAFIFGKTKLTSLEELSKALNSLPLKDVVKEIDTKRTELADWLEASVGDSELANRILGNYEPKNIIALIEERIKFLKKIAQEKEGDGLETEDVDSEKDNGKENEDDYQSDEVIEPLDVSSVKINSVPELISFVSGLNEEEFDSKIKPLKKDITDWVVRVSGEEDLLALVFSNNKSDFLEKIESARYSGKISNTKKSKKTKVTKSNANENEPDKKASNEKQTKPTDFDQKANGKKKGNLNDYTDNISGNEKANKSNMDDKDKANKDENNTSEAKVESNSNTSEKEEKPEEIRYKPKESEPNKEEKKVEKSAKAKPEDNEVGFFDDETEKKVEELASEIESESPTGYKQKSISDSFEEDFALKIIKEKDTKGLPAPTRPDEIKQPKNEYLASLVKTDEDKKELEYAQKSPVIKDRSELIDKKAQQENESLEDIPTQFLDNEKADYISQAEDKKKIEDKVDLLYSERVPTSKTKEETLSLPKNPENDFIESIENKNIELKKEELSEGNAPFEAKEINKYFKEYANAAKEAISLNVKEMESAIELKKEEIKLLNQTIESKKFMIETEIKEQVKGFNELKDKLTKEINSLVSERDGFKLQIESLKEKPNREASTDTEEITELKANIEALNERIKEQEAIILGYKENPNNSSNNNDSSDNNNSDNDTVTLESRDSVLINSSDDISSIKERILKLEEENKRLSELNKTLEKGLSPKEKAVINFSELKSDIASTKKEAGKRKSELNQIQRDIEAKRSELNTLLSDIENVKNLKAVKTELKADSERLEGLKKEVEAKKIELNNTTKLLDSAKEDYKEIVAANKAKVTQQEEKTDFIGPDVNPNDNKTTIEEPIQNDVPLEQSIPKETSPFENLSSESESNVGKSFDELLDGLNGNKQNDETFEDAKELKNLNENAVEKEEKIDDLAPFKGEDKDFEFDFPEPDIEPRLTKVSKKADSKKKKASDDQEASIDNFIPEFDKELNESKQEIKLDKAPKKPAKSSKKSKAKLKDLESEISKKEKEEIESKSKKLLEELEMDALATQKEAQLIENKGSEIINKESFGKKPKPVDAYIKTIDTLEDVYDSIREARSLVDIRRFDEAHDKIQEIEEAVSKMKLGSSDKKRIEVEVRLLKLEVEIA